MLCGQPSLLQRLLLFTVARLPLVTKPALSSQPGLCAILETALFFLSPAFRLRRSLFRLLSGCVIVKSAVGTRLAIPGQCLADTPWRF